MKLTHQHREEFADSVIQAIPIKHPQDRSQTIAALEELIWSLVPDDIKAIKKREPYAISSNSQWCYKVDQLEEAKRPVGYRGYQGHLTAHGVRVSANETLPVDKVSAILGAYKAHMEEQIERNILWNTIYTRTFGATTLAALKIMFPEFVDHMPVEQKKAVVVYKADEETSKLIKKAGYPVKKGKK